MERLKINGITKTKEAATRARAPKEKIIELRSKKIAVENPLLKNKYKICKANTPAKIYNELQKVSIFVFVSKRLRALI